MARHRMNSCGCGMWMCRWNICLLLHFSLSQWQMCNLLDMTNSFMLGKLSNFNFYFMVLNDCVRFATLHFLTLQSLLTTQSALWEPILLEDHMLVLLMDKILRSYTIRYISHCTAVSFYPHTLLASRILSINSSVDGRNSAAVLIGSLSHYLQGFTPPQER